MKKGFTLIELLIVIAIIGILSTIITFSYIGAKARARDATRKSDMNQIKSVLAIYYADQNPNAFLVQTSPIAADPTSTGLSTDYIKTFPADPVGTYLYMYQTDTDGQNYVLSCSLENANDSDIKTSAPTGFTLPAGYNFYVEND